MSGDPNLKLAEMEKRQERKSRWRNYLGLAVLTAATVWSVGHVVSQLFSPTSADSMLSGKKVIRFCHWQLEGRCIDAINWACREYEKLHPDVAVQQIEVPERAYEQWVRTQLIGRTAPDLIELRWGGNFVVQYFVPLTEIVDRPNPYNAADPNLAGVPWRETYIDDMQGGFNDELRDYFGMPLSVFTVRCYANRTLLKEVAGITQPPANMGEFMEACRKIREYEWQRQQKDPDFRLVPIAGSDYTANVFSGRYWSMCTWDLLDDYDTNCDGWISNEERVEAVLTGRMSLKDNPAWRAGHQIVFDISRYFNSGFMASRRDDSVFLFAQGNAAMVATGSWDAGSLYRQVAGDFGIMVFDFPIPAAGQPYSQHIRYRFTEADTRSGFPMGLSRFSRHKDTAIDFMHFLTSRKTNEELNKRFRWFPAIRGAEPDEILRPFRPQVEGTYKVMDPHLGAGQTLLSYLQCYNKYISAGEATEEDYRQFLRAAAGDREEFLRRYGSIARSFLDGHGGDPTRYDFATYLRDWRDWHYEGFISSYDQDFRKYCLDDLEKLWTDSYHAMVQTESSLAEARARSLREGMTAETRKTMVSLIHGQASRFESRALTRDTVDRMRKLQQPAGGAAE